MMVQTQPEGMPPSPEPENAGPTPGKLTGQPSQRELFLLVAMTGILFVSVMALFHSFFLKVEYSGDNPGFLAAARAIRHWNFQGLAVKAFWGLSYAMAGISFLTRISERNALLLISYCGGLATIVLAHRLWGGWIAGFFAVLNFDWMQRMFLAGSEPLFMALVCGAFLAARRERWWLAALLASVSTVVRPLGMFVLVALGLALLAKRDFRNFLWATLIGVLVGGLYILPLVLYFHDPLANVHTYQHNDWTGGRLFTWPFAAILNSSASGPVPGTNLALTWGWILFVLAGFLALVVTRDCRQYWRTRTSEMIFAVSYLCFVYTYNSPRWVRGSFPRFAIPILPFVLLALYRWLPKDRRVLWGVAAVSSVLAACSAIGIRNVAEALGRTLR